MKSLNLTFEEKDFAIMKESKKASGKTWEQFILDTIIDFKWRQDAKVLENEHKDIKREAS